MLKTAESVSPSHPDKLCDRISDAILDYCLNNDKDSRVAIETMGGHGLITITGELTTNGQIDLGEIIKIAKRIGGENNEIKINIIAQSPEISRGVDTGGAGDQGIMVGYACNDNDSLIPQETYLTRSLCNYIYERHPYDGKTQVTLNNGKIKTIVVSFCKLPKEDILKFTKEWWQKLSNKEIDFEILANPAGDWSQGGFEADTGLTGRKLAIDNYGPQIPIGGGAFSGKDSSKVDRSGAYMARRIAVDLLKENDFKEVIVKIAYAIGKKEPVMTSFEATNNKDEKISGEIDSQKYDLTPLGIINFLELKNPQFEKTAEWGSFGHGFTWDK
ncbi:MAG: methionine adenosyltransferase domain-containing protein [Patescibacteria group bacterium]